MDNVREQMEHNGLGDMSGIDLIPDGRIRKFKPSWEKRSEKRAWYILHELRNHSGNALVVGSYGWFQGSESFKFKVEFNRPDGGLSKADYDILRRRAADAKRKIADESKALHERCSKNSIDIFNACGTYGNSDYLTAKKIPLIGGRLSRGNVVLPVQDFDGNFFGLQFIDRGGNKKFLTGTQKTGHFCIVGELSSNPEKLGIGEGWASCVSCHQALGIPVLVAFDLGNLKPVAMVSRQRFPETKIIIFGDDDKFDKAGNVRPENPGRIGALSAAKACNGIAVFPNGDSYAF